MEERGIMWSLKVSLISMHGADFILGFFLPLNGINVTLRCDTFRKMTSKKSSYLTNKDKRPLTGAWPVGGVCMCCKTTHKVTHYFHWNSNIAFGKFQYSS